MPLLIEHSIQAEDWARETSERNGQALAPAPQRAQADPWATAVRKIVDFQHLGRNWDGLGAAAPSRELLESAIGLAYLLAEKGVGPPQCVVAGTDGSVNFEWQDPDGTIAEVEIDRPFHAEVMLMEPGKPARFWDLPTALTRC